MRLVFYRGPWNTGGDPSHDWDRNTSCRIKVKRGLRRFLELMPLLTLPLNDCWGKASTPPFLIERSATSLRHLGYFEGTGAMRQTADKAALLQGHYQSMNAGFRFEIKSFFHLIEGRRNSCRFDTLIDVEKELLLFWR